MTEPIVEYANEYTGKSMLIAFRDEETESIYPLENWIRNQQRFGGKVYRRKIIVVEDWEEVPPQDQGS